MATTPTPIGAITEAATVPHGAPRRLLWPAPGIAQQAAFAASVAAPTSHRGYTVAEARVRLLATGQPLWAQPIGRGDYTWCAKQPDSGSLHGSSMHVFGHDANAGKLSHCVAKPHAGCKASAPNKRDGQYRIRYDGTARTEYRVAAGMGGKVHEAAATNLAGGIAWLRAAGFAVEAIEATRSMADSIAALDAPAVAAALAGKATTTKRTTGKAKAKRTARKAAVVATTAAPDDDAPEVTEVAQAAATVVVDSRDSTAYAERLRSLANGGATN